MEQWDQWAVLLEWVDRGSAERLCVTEVSARYYLVGRADIDSDGDGVPDARETFVYGTDPHDAASIPGAGGWALHSEHDNTDHVSSAVLAKTIDTAAVLLSRIADAPRLPFARKIDPALARQVRTIARRDYSHPWSPKDFQYPT